MKKILISMLTMALFLALVPVTVFANQVTVLVDGQRVHFPDVQPSIQAGRTMVPLRGVFERMGFTINWDGDTSTATMQDGITVVTVTQGDPFIVVNDARRFGDVSPQIIDGRFMLPLRLVAEATGATVDWDGATNTVLITTAQNMAVAPEPEPEPEVIVEIEAPTEWGLVGGRGILGAVTDRTIGFPMGDNTAVIREHLLSNYENLPVELCWRHFYDILHFYTDDTMRVRTNTGAEVRISLTHTNTELMGMFIDMPAMIEGRGRNYITPFFTVEIRTTITGGPYFAMTSHPTFREVVPVLEDRSIHSPGAIVRIEEVEFNYTNRDVMESASARRAFETAPVIRTLGDFMVGPYGYLGIIGEPESIYRATVLRAPWGFTTEHQIAPEGPDSWQGMRDPQGRLVMMRNWSSGMATSPVFFLIPESELYDCHVPDWLWEIINAPR